MKQLPNSAVEFYFDKAGEWQADLAALRTLVLDCGLTEELKWGVPCYTFQQRNIVLLHVFKKYCALLFVKGALLPDPAGLLVQQTANTQAARQLRFTGMHEVLALEATVRAYLHAAIEVEKAGLAVPLKKTADYAMPEEFQSRLAELPALKTAFEALTPGRQRAYLLHFATPKQSQTRAARVARCLPNILVGKGLQE